MSREVLPNRQIRFLVNMYNVADNSPKKTGSVDGPIQVELAGDGDDGLFWDTDDSSWKAFGSVTTHPPLTHLGGSVWEYVLPAAGNTKPGATLKMGDAADDFVGVPTTISAGHETVLVRDEVLLEGNFIALK